MTGPVDPADEPDPDGSEGWFGRMSPPYNEIPAGVGMTALVVAPDDAAVAVTGFEAYSTGFRFTLAVRLRRRQPQLAPRGLFELVDPHPHAGTVDLDQRVLLGLEYPDGRRASTLDDGWPGGASGPSGASGDHLVFVQNGGSGGETAVDLGYWVEPLPPDGPVAFVVRWPAVGATESRVELDGGAIRAAAAHSRTLWPPQPPEAQPEPTPPPRPTSGWFAQPPS